MQGWTCTCDSVAISRSEFVGDGVVQWHGKSEGDLIAFQGSNAKVGVSDRPCYTTKRVGERRPVAKARISNSIR